MKTKNPLFFLAIEIFWGVSNGVIMIVAGVLIASFFIYRLKTPSVSDLSSLKTPQTSIIYDRTGKNVLYEIHGEENRKVLLHHQIPDVARLATIAAEDKSFYTHPGIDVLSIARAAKVNWENHGIMQGASTITQQLARNVYLSKEKTLTRKLMEALIAIKIERNFPKDEILDLYFNQVPYGSNAYGIESASQIFFKKEASQLTLSQAVLLAALPKAPTYYSPYGNHTDALWQRYREILLRMKTLKFITQEEFEIALNTDVLSQVAPFRQSIVAPHFVFHVIEKLEERYGADFLEEGGLRIVTSLDLEIQAMAQDSVRWGAERNLNLGATNAALVAIDPKTGDILAMVGSRDYFDSEHDGQVNVTTSLRQPGSSIKPIIYATAFEKGYEPETIIVDAPTNFGPDGGGRNYIPNNYDGQFHGALPMRKTLAMSLNVPAVKTLSLAGIDNAIDMAHRLGITSLNDRERYGLSLAIGGAEVKPLDLTSAFSVFANDGRKNYAHAIKKITGKKGEEYIFYTEETRVVDAQVARKINSILSDNAARADIFGENNPLYIPGRSVAAKTGTTQEFRDGWTVGYTPSIAVGVWVGNNDGRPMRAGSDGVFVAAPIWRNFMDKVLPRWPQESFIAYEQKIKNQENTVALKGKGYWEDLDRDKKDKKKKKS